MDVNKIQKMFSEMGLGTSEQRDKIVHDLSINMIDSHYKGSENIKTCNNTSTN